MSRDHLADFILDLSGFEEGKFRGEGQFGRVFDAVERATGRVYAVKHIKVPLAGDVDAQRTFIRELQILAANEHPGTLRLRGFRFSDDPHRGPTIVTEVMENGALSEVLKSERKAALAFTATQKSVTIFGIVAAMAYCHAQGIVHRDLKPENVFMTADFEPVVADFGISRHCTGDARQTGNLGTPLFMAPELFGDAEAYGFPVDVYAFAVTLYALFAAPVDFTDGRPARNAQQVIVKVMRGVRFVRKPQIPDYHWGVITACWDTAPERRPTFWELLRRWRDTHEYVLDGADRAAVLAYEARVYRAVGPPRVVEVGDRLLTRDENQRAVARAERLLAHPMRTRPMLAAQT
jgi:serine/threonine protein kinase